MNKILVTIRNNIKTKSDLFMRKSHTIIRGTGTWRVAQSRTWKRMLTGDNVFSEPGRDLTLKTVWLHTPHLLKSPPNLPFTILTALCFCPSTLPILYVGPPSFHFLFIPVIQMSICYLYLTCFSKLSSTVFLQEDFKDHFSVIFPEAIS